VINQERFGVYLSQGARSLGKRFNSEEYAVQVNGLEVAYHDPRGSSGMALVYATSPRGACHNQSDYFLADIYGKVETRLGMRFMKRHVGAEKAENVAIHQNWRTVFNSLVMCFFANVGPLQILDLVNSATGFEYDLMELLQVGERGWNLKRVINNRLGLNGSNDKLPKSLLKAYADGGSAGYQIPFNEMIQAYYQVRGWNPDTGYPNHEKLTELDLEWVEFL
jgi:aldehyde:ferredoxin oxidoreductase